MVSRRGISYMVAMKALDSVVGRVQKGMRSPIAKTFLWTLPLTTLVFLAPISCLSPSGTEKAETTIDDRALAEHWAPIWYQDIDSTDYTVDYITNFDFDGDWDGTNNWENQPGYPLKAYIYYWVIETDTNWFVGYASFHPRHLCDSLDSCKPHENDMGGCLLTIRKDGSENGQFLNMVTWNQPHFYTYIDYDTKPSNQVTAGRQAISGDVQFDGSHPYVYIEAESHGVYGDSRWEQTGFPDNDGIIYTYKGTPREPEENDISGGIVGYDLKSISELWERRYPETHPSLFTTFGAFRGDITTGIPDMEENAAGAPWAWDDENDFPLVIMQDFFLHPYFFVDYYYDSLGTDFSHNYLHRSYIKSEPAAIIVTVDGLSYGNTFALFDRNPTERTDYLEVSFQTMDHAGAEWDVIPFRWDGDAKFTAKLVQELSTFLRNQYNRASSQGKKFIVVSHSWGTVLTHVALSNEASGRDPVTCDLYVTLGDALAALYNREQPVPTVQLLLQDLIVPYLDRIGYDYEVSPPPKADTHVNYWAWQDAVSGPLSIADQNVIIDPDFDPEDLESLSLEEIMDLQSIWHGYQSLHLSHAPGATPVRNDVLDHVIWLLTE